MIDLAKALLIHEKSIIAYGGSKGIRDEGLLLAGLARPYATFDQQELYPSPVEKAAAIFGFEDEKYKMTIAASNGDIRFDEIKQWIEERLIKINP